MLGVPSGLRARKLAGDDNCNKQPSSTSDVEEIRDQQRKRNELPFIHRPNRPCLWCKKECVKPRDEIGGKEKEPALIMVS